MMVEGILALLLHAVAMVAMAVLLAGLLPWARARLAGRIGPPILRPWHDWQRLMRKQPVLAEGGSPLRAQAPAVALVATCVAALLVPSFTLGMATASLGDLVLVAALLALARVVLVLAALDTGTAPAALAAIRSARLAALAEPALVLVMLAVALLTGTTNLDAAIATLREALVPGVPMLLAFVGLASVVVAVEAEGDAVWSEASGWHAAAAEVAMALRRVVWLSLVAALLVPGGLALPDAGLLAWLVGFAAWVVKLAVLGAASVAAGTMLHRAGQAAIAPLMGAALLLGLLAALFLFAGQGLT